MLLPARVRVMVLAVVLPLAACERQDASANNVQHAPPAAQIPAAVDSVIIRVTGCDGPPSQEVVLVVEPWTAYVDSGADFRWVVRGNPGRVRVERARGNWPFADSRIPPTGDGAGPGQNIPAGRALAAAPGDTSKYDVVYRCRNVWTRVDPEIIIRPTD